MSTKVKSNKNIKAVSVTKAAPSTPRLSEDDKKADTMNYILNPNTRKMVKRDTAMGKKLVEAELSGEEVAKTMTDTQRLILVVQTLRDIADLDDSVIKEALATIQAELPRAFPSYWGGKKKEGRFPDHPKGPSNAYIFYTKAVRPSVKDAHPTLSPKELVSLMAKMWKETAEEDRIEYEEQAAADKERYESEMQVFETDHPDQARAKSSPSNGKPTKVTAYGLFCDANRQLVKDENPELDGKAVTKILADKWADLKKNSPNEADKFQEDADEANKDFEERTKEFYSSPGSVKGLSKAEQAKAEDTEHYELNTETGRHVLKEGWKKNVDGSFTSSKVKSPEVVKKHVRKTGPKSTKEVPKEVPKQVRTAKQVAAKKITEQIEVEAEDEMLVE